MRLSLVSQLLLVLISVLALTRAQTTSSQARESTTNTTATLLDTTTTESTTVPPENVLGVQMKLSSFLDLTQTGNIEDVLQQIKRELVNHGVSSFFEIKLRKVKKTQP